MTTWTSGSGRLRAWDLDPNNSELESHTSSGIITAISTTSITIEDLGYKLILTGSFSLVDASLQSFVGDRVDNLADFAGASGIVTRLDGYDASNPNAIEVSLNNLNLDIKTFASYASNDFVRDVLSGNDVINGNAYYNDQDSNPTGKWQLDGAGNSFNGNRLHGYSGNDVLNGNKYVDSLWGDSGNDTLNGYANNDFLYGGVGNDALYGGVGNDKLYGQTGNDALNGEDGDDILVSGSGADTLDGGAGVDTADYSDQTKAVSVTLNTNTYANLIVNGLKTDRIKNIENLIGGSGSDYLKGDFYSNSLTGGAGNDTLIGGVGNDTLIGGAGINTLQGGADNDTYQFSFDGNTTISDSSGSDTLVLTNTNDLDLRWIGSTLSISKKVDPTKVIKILNADGSGHIENGLINGITGKISKNQAGSTANDLIIGKDINDIITAGDGNDIAVGRNGDDVIYGGNGADYLFGENGNDTIEGNAGRDYISGDDGSDTIIINVIVGSSSDSSTVTVLGNENDVGQDTLNEFNLTSDIIKVVATNVSSFTHKVDTALGNTATGGTNNGAQTSFTSTTGLIELNQTSNLNWSDLGDIAVTFTNTSEILTEAKFESRLQYNLIGNPASNTFTGGDLNDTFNGGAGNDTLIGGAGDDWLEHTDDMGTPAGNDTLTGGTGNDTYVVDVLGATLVEVTNEGIDLVITHLSSFVLGANIENLTHDYGNEPGQTPYKNFTATGITKQHHHIQRWK